MAAEHGKIIQMYAAGECLTGHLSAQYRNLINDFGLTPVSQCKVKAFAGKEKKTRLQEMVIGIGRGSHEN